MLEFFIKKRQFLPDACCKKLYFSLVHSNIIQGIEIYGNTLPTYLNTLEKINNKILRILQWKKIREIHTIELYKAYNTIPITLLFKLHILKFVHTYYFNKHLLPRVFQNYFITNSAIHTHITRGIMNYHKSRVHSSTGSKMIKLIGTSLWNTIPNDVKCIPSRVKFLNGCKIFLCKSLE